MKRFTCLLLLCGGCLVGCGMDLGPAANLAINAVQQEHIVDLNKKVEDLQGQLDNLPVPQDGLDGEDGVTTVIVVHDLLPVPVPVRPVIKIDPVCVKVEICHKGKTKFVCFDAVDSHLDNHEDYVGACQ